MNKEIAEIFERIAAILEFKGENLFKVNAYRKAARVIQDLTENIQTICEEGRLRSVPGIGEGIAKKIEEYLKTGKMSKYEEVVRNFPSGLIELLGIQSLGPKTLRLAHTKLGVENLEDLKRVIEDGSLERLPGMGAKKVENIVRGIKLFTVSKERIPLGVALPLVEGIMEELKSKANIKQIFPAGSLRRMKETIGDIDILVSGKKGGDIIREFTRLSEVKEVLVAGETKGSIIVEGGVQVDLRVVDEGSYGAALQYFTGSKAHNIRLREMAKEREMKISEYGIYKGERKIGGTIEEELYAQLSLPWIPPELREDRGEIEAAISGTLPKLIEQQDIKGDLHVHSNYSDGTASIREIAEWAKGMGYEYIAICDHSRSVKFAGGLSIEKLLSQIEEISRLNKEMGGIRILTGIEVDIKQDGTLDYPDEILRKLDIVIAAIHVGFKQNVTERICRAMENPLVQIIAHPTGRLIKKREGYEIDLDEIFKKAAATQTALEINAYYDRLDLNDINCRKAKEMGIKLAIGTDAHHLGQLWMMKLGVGVSRRGWLEKEDLLNTLPYQSLMERVRK
jgi:DNA polymerase (family 10)